MSASVLDASAVLALVFDEPGSRVVEDRLEISVVSTANLAEVVTKFVDLDRRGSIVAESLRSLGVRLEPVTTRDAALQADIRERDLASGRDARLSLGDRLCLALGLRLGVPVLTADRAWADLALPVEVALIR